MKFLIRAINRQSDLYKYYFNILYSANIYFIFYIYIYLFKLNIFIISLISFFF